jgi:hypothetical protein
MMRMKTTSSERSRIRCGLDLDKEVPADSGSVVRLVKVPQTEDDVIDHLVGDRVKEMPAGCGRNRTHS